MRILWLSLILLFHFTPETERLVIFEKEITVSGNTSLGKFDCTYEVLGSKDTLSFNGNESHDVFLFDIEVADFGCGNFLLNNDFRKTIKAKTYPQAHVRVSNFKKNSDSYHCDLNLELVGKNLHFKDFKLSDKDGNLVGRLKLDFETLDLVAPSKFGGLIKVEESLLLSLSLAYIK